MLHCRAQHDYAAERQKRLDKIQDLEDKVRNLEAQEQTTDHDLEQFRNAITRSKNDVYKIRLVDYYTERLVDYDTVISLKKCFSNQKINSVLGSMVG